MNYTKVCLAYGHVQLAYFVAIATRMHTSDTETQLKYGYRLSLVCAWVYLHVVTSEMISMCDVMVAKYVQNTCVATGNMSQKLY